MGLFDKIYGGPLTQAVKNGDLAEVQKMLRNGGNPNEKQLGISVLMNACSAGNTEMVKLLIEKGADVNARDWDGMSILMVAATAPGFGDPDLDPLGPLGVKKRAISQFSFPLGPSRDRFLM